MVTVDLSLTAPHLNLDPTLAERLQPLLHSVSLSRGATGGGGGRAGLAVSQAQLKHSLYMTTSNFHSVSLVSITGSCTYVGSSVRIYSHSVCLFLCCVFLFLCCVCVCVCVCSSDRQCSIRQ